MPLRAIVARLDAQDKVADARYKEQQIIAEARQIGYKRMRLDTVEPVMKDAVAMYRKLGFREIPPYCKNPIAGALYMELQL